MPLGSPLSLVGLLLESENSLILKMDDGGVWTVEAGRAARELLGQRVKIEGRRDGFILVAARTIRLASAR